MPLDPEVLAELRPWKQIIDAQGHSVVGISKVPLEKKLCSVGECDLANFMADALVHHFMAEAHKSNQWNGAVIGLVPTGDIRTTIDKGGTSHYLHWNFSVLIRFSLEKHEPLVCKSQK